MSIAPTLSAADQALVDAVPLLAGLPAADRALLLGGAVVTGQAAGASLFRQDDPADRLFIVLEGQVRLYALTGTGQQSIIEVIETGQSFAEAAVFGIGRYPLHAETGLRSRLLEIPAAGFLHQLSRRPDLVARLLVSLTSWQRRLSYEIASLKSRSPAQRLGVYLLGCQSAGSEGDSSPLLTLPLTKVDLASRLGITPESLSRALARLEQAGVRRQGRSIRLEDPAALRRFCGSDGSEFLYS